MKPLRLSLLSFLLFGLVSMSSTKTVYAADICPSSTFAMSRQPGEDWQNNNVIVAPGAPFEVAGFKNNDFSVFPRDVELVIKKPDGSRERLGAGNNPVHFDTFNYPVGSYRIELYDPNYTSPVCYIYVNFFVREGWPTSTPTPAPGGTCTICRTGPGSCTALSSSCTGTGAYCPFQFPPAGICSASVPSCPTGRAVACATPGVTSTVAAGTVPSVPVTNCAPKPFSNNVNEGIMTGLGCIPTKLDLLVSWTLRTIALITGGITLLLLFYGGIMFITAAGDPKAMEEAKGIITAAIAGLLLILFSVLILKIIGFDVLGIPAITGTGTGGITTP